VDITNNRCMLLSRGGVDEHEGNIQVLVITTY